MHEPHAATRPVLLPAVLQVEGEAPCFGTIASLTEQGLAFNCQSATLAPHSVGHTAKLDFDLQGQHHTSTGLIVHVQDKRVLLSLRDASARVHAALLSISQDSVPSRATRLSTMQTQQACHNQFMRFMKDVVDAYYLLLPKEIKRHLDQKKNLEGLPELTRLQNAMGELRPRLIRSFTVAFPMYPEQLNSPLFETSSQPIDPADMERVDEWIRRTAIAQRVMEPLKPLTEELSHLYRDLLGGDSPFHLDAVLQLQARLISPLKLSLDGRVLCYEVMGQAFLEHASALYQELLRTVRDTPSENVQQTSQHLSLEQWLSLSASGSGSGSGSGGPMASTDPGQISALAALLARLTDSPGEMDGEMPALPEAIPGTDASTQLLIPGLLARDRIFSRFLPAESGPNTTHGRTLESLALLEPGSLSMTAPVLGGLSDLDNAALQGLHALMQQQAPIELAPERLAQGSQVRALMLQAQGLLLEYTLNGLTYQTRPDHPAWTLINALDALHQGADNRGQFLDPALHHAVSLTMQWLLGQENVDAALEQVIALLVKINTQLRADRQLRREQHLLSLGTLTSHDAPVSTGWCIVKRDNDAIPYEVVGKHDHTWALLDRSATHLLDIPEQQFLQEIDSGQIEETESFDGPFFERIADATLTSSLHAVHAYTWQDPASGCLKRNALMDELERRLLHPVTEPPTFCALIEIPTMRPGRSSLPGDELAVLQKRTGELLLGALKGGEHCGRLSDVSFMMVFSPQESDQLATRLSQLKTDTEALHPVWKMIGAVVPLADSEAHQTPSNTLRRANLACTPLRAEAGFDLSCLRDVLPPTNRIDPLPFSALYLRCQKIASCVDGAPSHYEILLGVNEDLVPHHTTQSFVVMAEQTGHVNDLDNWVLQSVLEWMDGNAAGIEQLSGLSVNLSGNSLTCTDHIDAMVTLLSRYPHLTHKLILEVTETAAIDNLDLAVRSLRKLRKLGCRVALDDFGSGYSSYGYVRSLPLDYLKIDGTYIRNLLNDKTDQALTASMVDVAHALGLKVIAEYVDSEAVYSWLKDIGVDYVQGYWIHKPERLDGLVLG